MALVICPDCGHEISEYANMCSNCGFPLQKFLKENNFTNISGVLVCPKCANVYNGLDEKFGMLQRLKCEYCGTSVIQTNENRDEIFKLMNKEDLYKNKCIELAKQYGDNQFDKNAFDNRYMVMRKSVRDFLDKDKKQSQQQSNIPKCPTCGSSNIHKMGVGERTASILGFGILSKKINKTWKCNNCGHTW